MRVHAHVTYAELFADKRVWCESDLLEQGDLIDVFDEHPVDQVLAGLNYRTVFHRSVWAALVERGQPVSHVEQRARVMAVVLAYRNSLRGGVEPAFQELDMVPRGANAEDAVRLGVTLALWDTDPAQPYLLFELLNRE